MSSSNLVDRIKEIPISEIIGQYLVLKNKGSDYVTLCPFHNDTNPSMQVNDKLGIFKCFSCEAGGDAIHFVRQHQKISFIEALAEIAEKFDLPIDEIRPKVKNPKHQMALRLNQITLKVYRQCIQPNGKFPREAKEFESFTSKRKLSAEVCEQFALCYAPGGNALTNYLFTLDEKKREQALHVAREIGLIRQSKKGDGGYYDTFRDRIIFPIWNEYGEVVGFCSRAVFDHQKAKYINSQDSFLFNKKKILYGLNFAKKSMRERSQTILVEGQMDCLALFKNGVENAAAIMGVAMSAEMAKKVAKIAGDIVFGLDSDRAGFEAAKRIHPLFLAEGSLPRYLDYSPHKDADEFLQKESRMEFARRVEEAPVFLDLLIKKEFSEGVPRSTDGKLAKLHNIFGLISPLEKSLAATERIVDAAKALALQSSPEKILESYEEFLLKKRNPFKEQKKAESMGGSPSSLPLEEKKADSPPENLPVGEEGEDFHPTRIDCMILENIAEHPECFKFAEHQDLLEYMSCDRVVGKLAEILKNVYFEVSEVDYPSTVRAALAGEQIDSHTMSAILGGLLRYTCEELDEVKTMKLMHDLKRRLQKLQLVGRREELKLKRGRCLTDQEGYECLREINSIQQQINIL